MPRELPLIICRLRRNFCFHRIHVDFGEEKLCNWVKAEVSSLASLAMFPYPDFVELVHGLLHDFRVIGQDASLEVSFVVCLHSDAGTCKVRASYIHLLAVKDKHLEVDSRTKHTSKRS